jgi:hypothetical protein
LPTLFALSSQWNDIFTVGGFIVGVFGFGYTIYQVHKVKVAALAAEEAAERTLSETKTNFRRFIASFAHRYLAEARASEEQSSWQVSALRTNDLADLLAQLPEAGSEAGVMIGTLREFGQVFANKQRDPTKRHSTRKWQALLRQLQVLLDRAQAPFPDRNEVQS